MSKIIVGICGGLFSIVCSFLMTGSAFAATSNTPRNDSEASTKAWCDPYGSSCGAAGGAMWVNNTPSNIYNNNVNISTTGSSVSATIYGSVYTSISGFNIGRTVYATNITDAKSSGSLPFTISGNNWLSRGATQAPGWFSSAGQGAQVNINVSSVPADGKTYSKFISVRRCWGYSPGGIDGACTVENTPVRITRSNPVNWTSSRNSFISTNKTAVNGTNGEGNPLTVTAGQTLYFRHRSNVSGTGVNYSLNVNGKGARLDSFNNPLIWQNSTVNNVTTFYQISPYAGDNGSFTSYTTNKDDIGRTICQRLWVSKTAHNAGSGYSNWVCAKVVAEPWELSLKTEIKSSILHKNYGTSDISVKSGEVINWKHTATNNTNYIAPADGTNRHGYGTLGYNLLYGRTSLPTNGVASPESHWVRDTANTPDINKNGGSYSYEASKSTFNAATGISGMYSYNNNGKPPTQYQVKGSDAGLKFCQRQYAGRKKDGGTEAWSNWRCAYVSYDYEITPCIKTPENPCGGVDIPVTPGEEKTPPTPTVDPSGKTKPTDWIVSKWKVSSDKEGVTTPTNYQDNTDGDPCNTYNGSYGITQAQSDCGDVKRGTQSFDGPYTFENVIEQFTMPEDAALGERYCFALSVSPFKMDAGEDESTQNNKKNWRHSAPYCFIAAKKPKMQVWGGNVYSGTDIQTNKTKFSTGTFGSWVEYAAISKGTINSFTSGANNNNNKLTMANKGGIYGKYGEIPTDNLASKIKARYTSPAATSASMICSNVADGKVCKQKETVSEVKVPAQMNSSESSRTVILDATNQNVYIDRDIAANIALGKASDAQAFIIIGKNIYISPDVTNIDAWLLASESVVTCANPSKSGTARKDTAFVNEGNCGKPLRVNGPVQTKNLNSWRTNGSMLNTAADPAEVYNLRADTYLWAASKGSGDGRFITTYTRELSPRF